MAHLLLNHDKAYDFKVQISQPQISQVLSGPGKEHENSCIPMEMLS